MEGNKKLIIFFLFLRFSEASTHIMLLRYQQKRLHPCKIIFSAAFCVVSKNLLLIHPLIFLIFQIQWFRTMFLAGSLMKRGGHYLQIIFAIFFRNLSQEFFWSLKKEFLKFKIFIASLKIPWKIWIFEFLRILEFFKLWKNLKKSFFKKLKNSKNKIFNF